MPALTAGDAGEAEQTGVILMPDLTVGLHRKGFSGISHSPPKVKETEQEVAYNPFWIDLSIEPTKLDPEWMMSGIIVNWLLKESDMGLWSRLILGVEASSASKMRAFLDKFCPGHQMTDTQIRKLLMLGHPTLAAEIRSNYVVATCREDKSTFVHENYSGVLGGELHYEKRLFGSNYWKINYNSGRYGPQHIQDPNDKALAKQTAKLLFKRYTGTEVRD